MAQYVGAGMQAMIDTSMRIGRWGPTEVRLGAGWAALAVLAVWSLAGRGATEALGLAAMATAAHLAAVVLHAATHLAAARRLGLRWREATLTPLGAVVVPHGAAPPRRVALAALAAPAASLALAGGLGFTALVIGAVGAAGAAAVLHLAALSNLVLGLASLLPLPGLPGAALVSAAGLGARWPVRLARAIPAGLAAGGAAAALAGSGTLALWLFLAALLAAVAGRHAVPRPGRVAEVMTQDPETVGPDATLADLVAAGVLARRRGFLPVVEGGRALGYVDLAVITQIEAAYWPLVRVGDVLVACDAENSVPPEATLADLARRMRAAGRRKFLVIDGVRLAGVVTLADLALLPPS
ncbi:CBS domain-containing protein [Rhodobacteraceae bacterium CCMM004]|nr:CBS domain-containing protein [Rhodobacteraceae bacterium CCMM004]